MEVSRVEPQFLVYVSALDLMDEVVCGIVKMEGIEVRVGTPLRDSLSLLPEFIGFLTPLILPVIAGEGRRRKRETRVFDTSEIEDRFKVVSGSGNHTGFFCL